MNIAIRSLKTHKAPGPDGITAEELKALPGTAIQRMMTIFNRIWAREEFPHEWGLRTIVTIPKPGNPRLVSNTRGLSLISVPGKLFAKILLRRILFGIEELIDEGQAGFRAGRSCADNIFLLRQLIHHHVIHQEPLILTFVDFCKAFDTVHRPSMYDLSLIHI